MAIYEILIFVHGTYNHISFNLLEHDVGIPLSFHVIIQSEQLRAQMNGVHKLNVIMMAFLELAYVERQHRTW